MKQNIRIFILAATACAIIFPKQAEAYLDPGTGSYVLQVVAAVLFGSLFAIKTFWVSIKKFISNLFSGKGKKNSEKPKNHDK